jgi:hypothetical protein
VANAPRASRPHMPSYGLLGPEEGRGLLPFSWAEERLRASRNFWVSTVSESGAPHAMPVWCVWEDGALWFSTDGGSRKARNLARDPRCVVTTEGAAEAVIVEGEAALETKAPPLARIAEIYEAKYGMGYPPDSHVYAVRPRVVFGFVESAAEFAGAATRWRFA